MKKQTPPITHSQELNAFRVRITKETATLESVSKNWKVSFDSTTKQYFFIISLYKEDNWAVLETIANFLYACSAFGVIDPAFLSEVRPLFDNCIERAKTIQEDSEATEEDILKQERIKQEYKEAQIIENENRRN